jgi:hypothetical protein
MLHNGQYITEYIAHDACDVSGVRWCTVLNAGSVIPILHLGSREHRTLRTDHKQLPRSYLVTIL